VGKTAKMIRANRFNFVFGFFVVILLMTLSYCAPITIDIGSEKTGSFHLANIKGKTLAFLPLRGTWGGLTANKILRIHLMKKLAQLCPDINILQTVQLQRLLASKGNEVGLQYATIMEKKYIPKGLFSKKDLAVFLSNDIDYLASISLNGDITGGPRRYIFVISMQIWEVKSGKIVWDLTLNGQILISKSDDDQESKQVLMAEMSDVVLTKLLE
jgi:hypothetical protein